MIRCIANIRTERGGPDWTIWTSHEQGERFPFVLMTIKYLYKYRGKHRLYSYISDSSTEKIVPDLRTHEVYINEEGIGLLEKAGEMGNL